MLPKEICLTAAGFRRLPSVVRGVLASREWLYAGDDEVEKFGEVSKDVSLRGVKKGIEKPKAMMRGRARVRNVGWVWRRRGWRSMMDRKLCCFVRSRSDL